MTTKSLILPILSFLALCLSFTGPSRATPPQADNQPVEFYRFRLGSFQVTPLLDSVGQRNIDSVALKPKAVKEALAADRVSLPPSSNVIGFVVHTGEQLVLVDAGMRGRLVTNLKASGYHPDQIDTVLLTHMHPDHCTGLSQDGKLVFPNATVICDRRESEYWLSRERKEKAEPGMRKRFETIQSALRPVVEANKLKTFDGATEVLPGIQSIPSYGHTPGHTAYLVESEAKSLLLWGDTVHIQQAQFAHPELAVTYDTDPEAAVKSRRNLMEMADRHGYLIASPHISFPGLGHLRGQGDGFRWIPLPYGTDF